MNEHQLPLMIGPALPLPLTNYTTTSFQPTLLATEAQDHGIQALYLRTPPPLV